MPVTEQNTNNVHFLIAFILKILELLNTTFISINKALHFLLLKFYKNKGSFVSLIFVAVANWKFSIEEKRKIDLQIYIKYYLNNTELNNVHTFVCVCLKDFYLTVDFLKGGKSHSFFFCCWRLGYQSRIAEQFNVFYAYFSVRNVVKKYPL